MIRRNNYVKNYRKRPAVIQAMQLQWVDWPWIGGDTAKPVLDELKLFVGIDIRTLEGTMRANIGDWIIKGVQGEFYPCRADIFEQTYEAVEGY